MALGARVKVGVDIAMVNLIDLEKVIISYCTSPGYTNSESWYQRTGPAGLM